MLKTNISITSTNNYVTKLKKKLERSATLSIEEISRKAQSIAKSNAKTRSGVLSNSILIDKDFSSSVYVGKVYISLSSVPYAKFVHFGTGKYNMLSNSSNKEYWYTKTTNFPDYASYGLTPITAPDGNQIVKVYPQIATPFMYTAYDNVKDSFRDTIKKYLQSQN